MSLQSFMITAHNFLIFFTGSEKDFEDNAKMGMYGSNIIREDK